MAVGESGDNGVGERNSADVIECGHHESASIAIVLEKDVRNQDCEEEFDVLSSTNEIRSGAKFLQAVDEI